MPGPGPLLRAGRYVAVAWDFLGAILAGAVLGFLVDGWLGSSPVGVATGTILGAVSGLVILVRMLRRLDSGRDGAQP